MGDVLNGGAEYIFPFIPYVFKVFFNLFNGEVVVEAFTLDEADMVIFYSDEIHSFVFFIGIGAAIKDDMSFCFQQIADVLFIG